MHTIAISLVVLRPVSLLGCVRSQKVMRDPVQTRASLAGLLATAVMVHL